MDERQTEFLQALVECGLSMGTIMAIGTIIQTEASRKLFAKRLLGREDYGETITDSVALQVLTDLMKEASSLHTA